MRLTMATDITVTSPDTAADSETESLVVHTAGDATLDDLMSDDPEETDAEIETFDGRRLRLTDSSSLKLEPRAKTRLLSRSHSANDLSDNQTEQHCAADGGLLKTEPPRRNSSGECPPPSYEDDGGTPSPKPSANTLLQDLDLTRYKGTHQHRSSLTPTSSLLQLSPVNVHYNTSSPWKSSPQPPQQQEDNFSVLLQTTAERVLTRLKHRQQDLGGNGSVQQQRQQKSQQRKHSLQPPSVPRKLQPLMRDGSKTPRSESDLRSLNGDGDFGPLSAA